MKYNAKALPFFIGCLLCTFFSNAGEIKMIRHDQPIATSVLDQDVMSAEQYECFYDYPNQPGYNDSTHHIDYCDPELVFMVCEKLASIIDESEFYQALRLSHLQDANGVFSVRFALNCKGEIVSTELLSNKTSATREEVLNVFSESIRFNPATHRGISVDSYYTRGFRIRKGRIKLLK